MITKISRALRLLFLTVGLGVFLAACGGSSPDDSATEAAAETTSTVEATTTTEPATTTTKVKKTTTTTSTTTTVAPAAVDAADPVVVAYCTASAEADAVLNATNPADPDSFRALVDFQIEALSAVEPPAVIADDINTILAGVAQYPAILEPLDYDVTAAEDQIVAIAEDPEFVAASDRLDLFEEEYCPEVEDDISSPPTTDNPLGLTEDDIRGFLSTPEGRQGIAAGVATTSNMNQEEALCFVESTSTETLIELFSLGVGESTTPSPEVQAGMLAGLEACGLTISAFTG